MELYKDKGGAYFSNTRFDLISLLPKKKGEPPIGTWRREL